MVLFLLATKIILREYPPESTAVHKFTIPKKRMLTPKIEQIETRSHLKNRILVQVQGGAEVQPAPLLTGSSTRILKYFEELKRGPNTEIEPERGF